MAEGNSGALGGVTSKSSRTFQRCLESATEGVSVEGEQEGTQRKKGKNDVSKVEREDQSEFPRWANPGAINSLQGQGADRGGNNSP